MFIDFESLCYDDVFTFFYGKFTSSYFCLFYHLFGIESLQFSATDILIKLVAFSYKFESV